MADLVIYDTFSKKKKKFTPISGKKVNMYVCGMTVYDLCHLGHLRVMISFDMIIRYLKSQNFDVTYVRNITDIDDKIFQKAFKEKKTWQEITNHYIKCMHEDCKIFNMIPPSGKKIITGRIISNQKLIILLISISSGKSDSRISRSSEPSL